MYCFNCGTKIENPNARFCPLCGTGLYRETAPVYHPPQAQVTYQQVPAAHIIAPSPLQAFVTPVQRALIALVLGLAAILMCIYAPVYEISLFGESQAFTLFQEYQLEQVVTGLLSAFGYGAFSDLGMAGVMAFVLICLFVVPLYFYLCFILAVSMQEWQLEAKLTFLFLGLAVLVHNIYLMSISTVSAYGYSYTVGAPTVWSWLLVILCTAGVVVA